MKKSQKVVISLVIIIILITGFKYVNNPERKIFSMVQENEAEYKAVVEAVLNGEEKPVVKDVNNIYVREGEHTIVDFFVTGFGLAPASVYYGFYYSPEDLAMPYLEERAVLTEYETDMWKWKGSGDNNGVTKKITDGWYYYEASF